MKTYILKAQIKVKLDEVAIDFERSNFEGTEHLPSYSDLPEEGMNNTELSEMMLQYRDFGKWKWWESDKISGAIYHGGDELTEITSTAYKIFEWSNPLHPDIFPGIRKMEAEIIAMVIKMFNGDPNFQGGVITGGGTESIIMALKAYRDWAREEKGIYSPNIIVPISAHAAFDKGSEYLGIEIVHAPLDPTTFSVDIKKLRKLINRNTIMIAGSVPNYPYGTTDDISLLSDIAIKKGIGLHVDCCLGSFVAAFMESSGYSLPPFDFRVPGVSSISCDTHKYGFAPKGSSIIMYRTKELRKYQFFVQPNWVGGIYVSPSFPGSRAGTIVAGCWAILMYFGKNGYIKSCKKIIETKLYIEEEIKKNG